LGVQRSPRIATLAHEIDTGNRQALVAFWKGVEGNAPLVEAIDGDPRHRCVTFLWRATNNTARVTMMGGLPTANLLKSLHRLADSDLWYCRRCMRLKRASSMSSRSMDP